MGERNASLKGIPMCVFQQTAALFPQCFRLAGKYHGMSSLFNLVAFACSIAYARWFVGL